MYGEKNTFLSWISITNADDRWSWSSDAVADTPANKLWIINQHVNIFWGSLIWPLQGVPDKY